MPLYKREGELTSQLIASGLELIAKCTSSYMKQKKIQQEE